MKRIKISGLRFGTMIVIVILKGGAAWAQRPPVNEPPEGKALPCYHKEVEDFAFLEGDWAVRLSTRSPDGTWEESTATSQIKRDLAGCLLVERFTGSRQKRPFHVLSLFAFDSHSRLYNRH